MPATIDRTTAVLIVDAGMVGLTVAPGSRPGRDSVAGRGSESRRPVEGADAVRVDAT